MLFVVLFLTILYIIHYFLYDDVKLRRRATNESELAIWVKKQTWHEREARFDCERMVEERGRERESAKQLTLRIVVSFTFYLCRSCAALEQAQEPTCDGRESESKADSYPT